MYSEYVEMQHFYDNIIYAFLENVVRKFILKLLGLMHVCNQSTNENNNSNSTI